MCFYDPRNGATFVTLLSLFLTTRYPEMHAMLAVSSILLTVLRTSPCCLQEAYCYQMILTEYSKQSPAWKQANFAVRVTMHSISENLLPTPSHPFIDLKCLYFSGVNRWKEKKQSEPKLHKFPGAFWFNPSSARKKKHPTNSVIHHCKFSLAVCQTKRSPSINKRNLYMSMSVAVFRVWVSVSQMKDTRLSSKCKKRIKKNNVSLLLQSFSHTQIREEGIIGTW